MTIEQAFTELAAAISRSGSSDLRTRLARTYRVKPHQVTAQHFDAYWRERANTIATSWLAHLTPAELQLRLDYDREALILCSHEDREDLDERLFATLKFAADRGLLDAAELAEVTRRREREASRDRVYAANPGGFR